MNKTKFIKKPVSKKETDITAPVVCSIVNLMG